VLIKWEKGNEAYKLRIIICNKWETIKTILCIPEAKLEYVNVLLKKLNFLSYSKLIFCVLSVQLVIRPLSALLKFLPLMLTKDSVSYCD